MKVRWDWRRGIDRASPVALRRQHREYCGQDIPQERDPDPVRIFRFCRGRGRPTEFNTRIFDADDQSLDRFLTSVDCSKYPCVSVISRSGKRAKAVVFPTTYGPVFVLVNNRQVRCARP